MITVYHTIDITKLVDENTAKYLADAGIAERTFYFEAKFSDLGELESIKNNREVYGSYIDLLNDLNAVRFENVSMSPSRIYLATIGALLAWTKSKEAKELAYEEYSRQLRSKV